MPNIGNYLVRISCKVRDQNKGYCVGLETLKYLTIHCSGNNPNTGSRYGM